jgi:hypothetical protein
MGTIVDLKNSLKRWGKKDFGEAVEADLWGASTDLYELLTDNLHEYDEFGDITFIKVHGEPYDRDGGIHVRLLVEFTYTDHPYSRDCNIDGNGTADVWVKIDKASGEGDFKSCEWHDAAEDAPMAD